MGNASILTQDCLRVYMDALCKHILINWCTLLIDPWYNLLCSLAHQRTCTLHIALWESHERCVASHVSPSGNIVHLNCSSLWMHTVYTRLVPSSLAACTSVRLSLCPWMMNNSDTGVYSCHVDSDINCDTCVSQFHRLCCTHRFVRTFVLEVDNTCETVRVGEREKWKEYTRTVNERCVHLKSTPSFLWNFCFVWNTANVDKWYFYTLKVTINCRSILSPMAMDALSVSREKECAKRGREREAKVNICRERERNGSERYRKCKMRRKKWERRTFE